MGLYQLYGSWLSRLQQTVLAGQAVNGAAVWVEQTVLAGQARIGAAVWVEQTVLAVQAGNAATV